MKSMFFILIILAILCYPVTGNSFADEGGSLSEGVHSPVSAVQAAIRLLYLPQETIWRDSCKGLLDEAQKALSSWPKSDAVKRACWFVLAQALAGKPDCLSSIDCYLNGITLTDDNRLFPIYKAEAHIRSQRFVIASSLLKQLQSAAPQSARLAYDLGRVSLAQGRFAGASSLFESGAKKGYPACQLALRDCERILSLVENPDLGISDAEKLLETLSLWSSWQTWEEQYSRLTKRFPKSLSLAKARAIHQAYRISSGFDSKEMIYKLESMFNEISKAESVETDTFNSAINTLQYVEIQRLRLEMLFALSEFVRCDQDCGLSRDSSAGPKLCTLVGSVPGLKRFYPNSTCLRDGISLLLLNDRKKSSWNGPYLTLSCRDNSGSPFMFAKTSTAGEALYWCVGAGPDFSLQTEPCSLKADPADYIVQFSPGHLPSFLGFD